VVADLDALTAVRSAGADACMLVYEDRRRTGVLEDLIGVATWLDCALDVRDEEQLERSRADRPGILVISERDPDKGETELERAGACRVRSGSSSSREQ
jgi:hypothetical protein